jgi:CheY-like chemotaxis protein
VSRFEGLRILVVEDEPVVAMYLEDMLEALGCQTIGPASRLADGLVLVESETFDAAILDINLGGERSTPIAEALRQRGVPFAFASGYGVAPEGFGDGVPMIEKPYREAQVAGALDQLLPG